MTDISEGTREQLLMELWKAQEDALDRDIDAVERALTTIRRLVQENLPEGELAEQLRHGCDQVERLVADEPLVAAEYLRAMHDRAAEEL